MNVNSIQLQFADNYGSDARVTEMLDAFTWIITPVYNIDGYEFTYTVSVTYLINSYNNNGGFIY